MGHEPGGEKRLVSMVLTADLVRRATAAGGDLSGTVNRLLASYVADHDEAPETLAETRRQMSQWARASAESIREHGAPGDGHEPF